MTNYLPRNAKKRLALARLEARLQNLVASDADSSRIVALAVKVRDARVAAASAYRATIVPRGDYHEVFQPIDARLQSLAAASVQQILVEFGFQPPSIDEAVDSHDSAP